MIFNALRARRAALRTADSELRLENLQRNPETVDIFEAWVNGNYTESEAAEALKQHYATRGELAKVS